MTSRRRLLDIYEGVQRRTDATLRAHPWWPCRRGCDLCCRRLADVPRVTSEEWALLREGIEGLPQPLRAEVDGRLALLAARPPDAGEHVVCPLLDESDGACRLYAYRPATCRTYGFYVEREHTLGCATVLEASAASGESEAIVWGNEEGVRHALATLSGEALPLTEWLVVDPPASSSDPVDGGAGPSPSPSSSM